VTIIGGASRMTVSKAHVTSEPLEPEPTSAQDSAAGAAVMALLDHLAEELAREYLRLMEKAAEGVDGDTSR
jgi:hypothetical protein